MKGKNLHKIVLSFAFAMLLVFGAYAQTHNNTITKGDEYTSSATPIQITTGKSLPVWVEPDTYFHPNWDPLGAGTYTLTDGFTWTFSNGGDTDVTLANQTDNYIELTAAGAAGSGATITVYETAPSAYGGCVDATPTSLVVNIVATPTISAPATTYYKFCDGDHAASGPATVDMTLAGVSDFNFVWSLMVYNTSATDTTTATEWYDNSWAALGASGYHTEFTQASPDAVAAAGAFDLMANASVAVANTDFIVRGSARTVYEFTASEANDLVSRKCDFLSLTGTATASITDDQYVYYDVDGAAAGGSTHVVQVVVLPAPSTGPIYHVPDTWAQ